MVPFKFAKTNTPYAMRHSFVLLTGLLLLWGSLAQGQSRFRFGIHTTPLVSFISSDAENLTSGSKLLFGYGGLAEYQFADNYAFGSGFEILQRGGTITVRDTTLSYKPSYLQFPLLLKMRTREFGYTTFFAEFGGALAFRLSHNTEVKPALPGMEEPENINLFNATFRFGIGAEYSFGGSTSVTAGLHYNRSLIDNLGKNALLINSAQQHRFDYVALTAGILF